MNLKPNSDNRVLLNFEAVDYHATVWVNSQPVGEHIGVNTTFRFDITAALKNGENEIVVRLWEEPAGIQLRGKQSLQPARIWYSAASGIWQTVWLEEVAPIHLAEVQRATTISPATINVTPSLAGPAAGTMVRVTASLKQERVSSAEGPGELKLAIADAKLWSAAHPIPYDLQIDLLDARGKGVDSVKSYTGIREVGKQREADGNWRFTLSRHEKSPRILADLKAEGVSAGVYTQTTAVEGELNGLMTDDRAVIKIPAAKLAEWHRQLGPDIKR